jgi:hypothetical protein
MPNIARKNRMGQNLNKMLKLFPKEYSFYPKTWILPSEMGEFRQQFDAAGNSIGNKIYIIKHILSNQFKFISLVIPTLFCGTPNISACQDYCKLLYKTDFH